MEEMIDKKSCLPLVVLFIAVVFLNKSLAQEGFQISPDYFEDIYTDEDISNDFASFSMLSEIENTSNDTLEIRWTKVIASDCQAEWDIFISDRDLDYVPQVLESPFPMTLYPGEVEFPFIVHAWPRMAAGCCKIEMIFSDFDNPTNVLDTAEYNISINDASCAITSANGIMQPDEKVYPNPTNSIFYLESKIDFDQIQIINNLGRLEFSMNYDFSSRYDISALSRGLYIINLIKDGNSIGQSRIMKYD